MVMVTELPWVLDVTDCRAGRGTQHALREAGCWLKTAASHQASSIGHACDVLKGREAPGVREQQGKVSGKVSRRSKAAVATS